MKFFYLIAAYFFISGCFACNADEKVENVTPEVVYHQMVDTIITFDPETLKEKVKLVRYEITNEEMEQRKKAEQKRLSAEKLGMPKANMQIVKNEKTGEVDTIITFSVEEIK